MSVRLLLTPLATLFFGCAAGSLHTADGDIPLRTAWFIEEPFEGGEAARFFLSSSDFDCELPAHVDPETQARALQEWWVSACREDAHHVFLSVYADPIDWNDTILTGEVGTTWPIADAATVDIREAVLGGDGVVPWATELDYKRSLGEGGTVTLRGEGRGRFWWPSISGDFRAQRCESDAPTVLDAMITSAGQPSLACP